MQRMIRITGEIAPCPGCGKQPKHWNEPARGGAHFLECSPCNVRTARHSTAQQAFEAWEQHETAIMRVAA
jgi:hypothetical protein